MTALLVAGMTSPLWLGFGAIGWQLWRAIRRLAGKELSSHDL
jgi:hypothetical protein